jgi:hypothetical protein
MVVLYMVRGYNFNTPAGHRDESRRFYNRAFRSQRPSVLALCVSHAAIPFACLRPSHLATSLPCPQSPATPS